MRLAVVFLAACAPGLWAEATVIRTIRFEGGSRPPEIRTQAGDTVDATRLTEDVRHLWATGRYEDIRVELAGGDLVFHVVAKERLRLNEVRFEDGGERRDLGLKKGMPVDRAAAAQIAASLKAELRKAGHPDPRITAKLVPLGGNRADLRLSIEPGDRVAFGEVRLTGSTGLPEAQLRKALRASHSRTLVPGLWKHRPPFSEEAAGSDLARVRSALLSEGYYDAKVRLDGISYAGKRAEVALAVDSGRRYPVGGVEIVDLAKGVQFSPGLKQPFRSEDLCRCLFGLRRAAQREGRLDFAVEMKAEDHAGAVDLSARIRTGPPYRVGRIDFQGNRSIGDSTIRRTFVLEEAQPLDLAALERSLARVNRLAAFAPLAPGDVQVVRNPETGTADVLVRLNEAPRGRLYLSGPVGPFRIGGPLQAAIVSRLPGWGRGIREASTYYLSFSVSAFSNPLFRALQLAPKRTLLPVFAIERPYVPGQGWRSGFAVAPQLGWKGMLASYGVSQLRRASGAALQSPPSAAMQVPVERLRAGSQPAEAGTLLCEPRRSRWSMLRRVAALALEFALPPVT